MSHPETTTLEEVESPERERERIEILTDLRATAGLDGYTLAAEDDWVLIGTGTNGDSGPLWITHHTSWPVYLAALHNALPALLSMAECTEAAEAELNTLQNELALLCGSRDGWEARCLAAEAERDALRRIVDTTCPIAAFDTVTGLRAEMGNMRDEMDALRAENEKLRAENERLKDIEQRFDALLSVAYEVARLESS